MKSTLFFAVLLLAVPVRAQQASPSVDRYKVQFLGAEFFSAPDSKSKKIGEVPADVVVTPLAKQSYWLQVKYKGKTGWISSAACDRLMASPSADLDILFRGYRQIGGKYHYYFRVTNRGVEPHTGDFRVRLYSGDQELPLRGVGFPVNGPDGILREIDATPWTKPHIYTADEVTPRGYPLDPGDVIKPAQMRTYYLIADGLATRYVFETAQGQREGRVTATP